MEIPSNYILPWFSGNGYHVQIPDIFGFEPSRYLPATVKETMTRYFPESDNIFDGARLIRVGLTMNDKSGLYKIPLQIEELMQLSWQDIHEMAKTNDRSDTVFNKDWAKAAMNTAEWIMDVYGDDIKEVVWDTPSGRKLMGLSAGCYLHHKENYAKATQQMWWSGLVVKRNVDKGEYDLEMIEYNTVRRKYGKR